MKINNYSCPAVGRSTLVWCMFDYEHEHLSSITPELSWTQHSPLSFFQVWERPVDLLGMFVLLFGFKKQTNKPKRMKTKTKIQPQFVWGKTDQWSLRQTSEFFLPLYHQQDTESSGSHNFLASRVRAKHQPKITTGEMHILLANNASDQLKIPAVKTKNWLYSTLHPNILYYFPRVVNGFPFFKQKKRFLSSWQSKPYLKGGCCPWAS